MPAWAATMVVYAQLQVSKGLAQLNLSFFYACSDPICFCAASTVAFARDAVACACRSCDCACWDRCTVPAAVRTSFSARSNSCLANCSAASASVCCCPAAITCACFAAICASALLTLANRFRKACLGLR